MDAVGSLSLLGCAVEIGVVRYAAPSRCTRPPLSGETLLYLGVGWEGSALGRISVDCIAAYSGVMDVGNVAADGTTLGDSYIRVYLGSGVVLALNPAITVALSVR